MKKFTFIQKLKSKFLFALTVFSLIPFFGYSTHIVGGELNYKCLGNNLYEIRLRVYRDCYTGVPPFDNPAVVGIFGSDNKLFTKVLLNFPGSTVLPPTLAQANPCVKVPTNICVEVAEYVGTVTLPPRVGGYQLAYQRCCRNPTVDNLVNPGNQGATYYAVIPDQNVIACNSNPVFKQWPPIFVCANSPIIFDHSATDADGDSIAYTLCSPFTGATSGSSQPNPPSNPPYTFVTFKAPYSATDPMGGIPLSVDPKTGLLSGLPTTLGQYVVGVCANEYRNGVLLSTTKRDFQFNVVTCQPDISAAAASFVSNCTNHTVTFTNTSSGSNNFFWNFGDTTTVGDTSLIASPTYTYPTMGTYTVTLIAFNTSNPKCNDTLKLTVVVDTCKPCGMTLATSKVDASCGASSGCTPNAAPVFVNTTEGLTPAAPNTATIIFNHATSGADRLLLVEVLSTQDSTSGVTYAGQNLTFLGRKSSASFPSNAGATAVIEMYYLVNPPAGTNSVVVTFPSLAVGNQYPRKARAITFSGVDQTNPVNGIATSGSGSTCPALINVPSGSNELIVDLIGRNHNANTLTPEAGQTALYAQNTVNNQKFDYRSSSKPGSTGTVSTGYNWTFCAAEQWIMLGISLKPGCPQACAHIVDTVPCSGIISMSGYGNGGSASSSCNTSGTIQPGLPGGTTPGSIIITIGGNPVPLPTAPPQLTFSTDPHATCPKTAKGTFQANGTVILDYYLWIADPNATGTPTLGSATVTPTGGMPTYNYSWAPGGQVTNPATNLTPGSYTVTVVDAANCVQTAVVTIDASSAMVLTPSQTDPTSCSLADGTATVTATGNIGPVTYTWNTIPVQTGPTATGLPAGIYVVNVVDSAGCSKSQTFTLVSPSNIVVTTTKTDVLCNGTDNGTVTATPPTGTTGPVTYSWTTTPVQTTPTATGLPPGYYVVTVTDSLGCKGTAAATVGKSYLSLTSSQTNVKCYGDSSGTATMTPSGGTTIYNYSWNTVPVQNSATATNLKAGTYVGKVTDSGGCMDSVIITITEPLQLLPEPFNTSTISCSGVTNGSALVLVSGGVAPYTYSWCDLSTDSTVTGLPEGKCYITVTDSNLCVASDTVNIVFPLPLSLTYFVNNLTCNNDSTGAISINPTGGKLPYTYSWSTAPVQPGQTLTNLTAGTYSLTVTDANGCTATVGNIVVTEPAPITFTTASTPTGCTANVGTATVTPSGGTPGTTGFTYVWNTVPAQFTSTATGLPGGIYTLVATDSAGCVGDTTVIVSSPIPPIPSAVVTDAKCFGGNTGSITGTATGGISPYGYSWNTSPPQLTPNATGLIAGTYKLTVTDNVGCTGITTVTVNQPTAVLLTATKTDAICPGVNTGTGTATASGGNIGTYTYIWQPINQIGQSVTGLAGGTYTVTATDSKGCTVSTTVVVVQPTPIITTYTMIPSGCSPTLGTGTATVLVTGGGTPNYSYVWNTSPPQVGPTATGLPPGVYVVTITDANTCNATASVTVTGQGGSSAVANFDVALEPSCENVIAQFINTSTGATSYEWIFSDGTKSTQQNPSHAFPFGTKATVMLIATVGSCPDTLIKTITTNPFSIYVPTPPNVFTPNGDGKNDCFEMMVSNGMESCVKITIFDRWGLKMYDNGNGICWDGRTASGKAAPDGTYYYIMTFGESEFHGFVSLMR